jgi:phosphatidylethanolamine-binding protein (PEBP) family uncharacterized protein
VGWLIHKIPADECGLPEGYKHKAIPKEPVDVLHGSNSLGNVGYDGPLGALGRSIRYRFRLLALDRALDLPPGLDKAGFFEAASSHVLDQGDLAATYERGP